MQEFGRLMNLDETGRCFDIYQFPTGLYIWCFWMPPMGRGSRKQPPRPRGIHTFVPTGSPIKLYEFFQKLRMGIKVYAFDN